MREAEAHCRRAEDVVDSVEELLALIEASKRRQVVVVHFYPAVSVQRGAVITYPQPIHCCRYNERAQSAD